MQIDSTIASEKIDEFIVKGKADFEKIANDIFNKDGIAVQPRNGVVNGFLVSEQVGGDTKVYVYAYTESKPSHKEKMQYIKGEVIEITMPQIRAVKDIEKLKGKQVIL